MHTQSKPYWRLPSDLVAGDLFDKMPKKSKVLTIPCLTPGSLLLLDRVCVGLDLSLTNPGVAVVDPFRKTVSLFFWRNRKSESSMSTQIGGNGLFSTWRLEVICMKRFAGDAACNRYERYTQLAGQITAIVTCSAPDPLRTILASEGYAFNARNSSSTTVLVELGGVVKTMLHAHGYLAMEIPPTQVKKEFAESGRALKGAMHTAFVEIHGFPDLCRLMGLSRDSKNLHPVEDMVDAFAVALSAARRHALVLL